jgi:FG-GAP-like repeat
VRLLCFRFRARKQILASGRFLAFWKGNGDGTLQPPVVTASFERPLLAGDFNGDGIPDIAGPGLDIYYGNGDGTFQNALQVSLPYPMAVAAGDFNGDGRQDFAVALTPSNSIAIVLASLPGWQSR